MKKLLCLVLLSAGCSATPTLPSAALKQASTAAPLPQVRRILPYSTNTVHPGERFRLVLDREALSGDHQHVVQWTSVNFDPTYFTSVNADAFEFEVPISIVLPTFSRPLIAVCGDRMCENFIPMPVYFIFDVVR